MKTKLGLVLITAVLLASCGSNKGFHKKHHSHRNWVKVEAVESGNEVVVLVDNEEYSSNERSVQKKNNAAATDNTKEETMSTVATSTPSVTEEQSVTVIEIEHQDETEVEKVNSEEVTKRPVITAPSLFKSTKNLSESLNTQEKSLGELLLLALLIVLIIIVFSWIDGALGGILGAVLVVFLILLLLRYFGII